MQTVVEFRLGRGALEQSRSFAGSYATDCVVGIDPEAAVSHCVTQDTFHGQDSECPSLFVGFCLHTPPSVCFRKLDAATCVLIDPKMPNWVAVDEIGKEIVDLCDGRRSLEAVTESLWRAASRGECRILAAERAVKVTDEGGPILPGDLLVSSCTPGHAMRWSGEDPCSCDLLGKALEPMSDSSGVILALLTAH